MICADDKVREMRGKEGEGMWHVVPKRGLKVRVGHESVTRAPCSVFFVFDYVTFGPRALDQDSIR